MVEVSDEERDVMKDIELEESKKLMKAIVKLNVESFDKEYKLYDGVTIVFKRPQ